MRQGLFLNVAISFFFSSTCSFRAAISPSDSDSSPEIEEAEDELTKGESCHMPNPPQEPNLNPRTPTSLLDYCCFFSHICVNHFSTSNIRVYGHMPAPISHLFFVFSACWCFTVHCKYNSLTWRFEQVGMPPLAFTSKSCAQQRGTDSTHFIRFSLWQHALPFLIQTASHIGFEVNVNVKIQHNFLVIWRATAPPFLLYCMSLLHLVVLIYSSLNVPCCECMPINMPSSEKKILQSFWRACIQVNGDLFN